jgi:hypothetical protein
MAGLLGTIDGVLIRSEAGKLLRTSCREHHQWVIPALWISGGPPEVVWSEQYRSSRYMVENGTGQCTALARLLRPSVIVDYTG